MFGKKLMMTSSKKSEIQGAGGSMIYTLDFKTTELKVLFLARSYFSTLENATTDIQVWGFFL